MLCGACAPTVQTDLPVPSVWTEPLVIPPMEPPVTVRSLLAQIKELEGLVDTANDRFAAIRALSDKGEK